MPQVLLADQLWTAKSRELLHLWVPEAAGPLLASGIRPDVVLSVSCVPILLPWGVFTHFIIITMSWVKYYS